MRKRPMRITDNLGEASRDRPSDAAPASKTTVLASRANPTAEIPIAWLDRLLFVSVDLPVQAGEHPVVEAMIDALAAILPSYAIGAAWISEAASGRRERVILRRLPETARERLGPTHPSRVFTEFSNEYVSAAGDDAETTLHLASDDADLDPEGSPQVKLIDRAARVIGRALVHARAASAAGAQRSSRRFEKRMIQADKLATFGQLAAGVVHELNNPLTSIVAYSEFLIRQAKDGEGLHDPESLERVRRIGESANRMLRFTRDLVSYARPSTGMAGPVLLHDVIDQAIAFCEHVLSSVGVRVERRYSPAPITVRGVSEQLVQVFVNLLTNACQATSHGAGRVVVATSREGHEPNTKTVVLVADNGAGIAAEHLPHVFVPFFTTKRDRNGTGLGLSIVKSIVESHDGSIRVTSELGKGTEFVIDFRP